MKLTLNIEPSLIEQIKKVAKKRNTSISKMAESFFKMEITAEKEPFKMKSEDEISDWVKSLSLAKTPIPDFDEKKEYGDHIMRKYGL